MVWWGGYLYPLFLGAIGATIPKLKTRGAREVPIAYRDIDGIISFNVHPNGGWESLKEVSIRTRAKVSQARRIFLLKANFLVVASIRSRQVFN